ncbi:DUF2637 domain-containing protein [Kibdelosporangium persicum]|uniref:DUF2637 domain-containing protein n=1 Tax=Kibdelosporangium persicum TaxID=2698649 RepID=UPI0015637016|nr:DUF2637 domain-containing protein [Kibdelosporangium persicum]
MTTAPSSAPDTEADTATAPNTAQIHLDTPDHQPQNTITADPPHAIAPAKARNAVQVTTVAAVSVVAAVAAVVSFMHMYELAARAGEGWRAWLVPLAIDGLVVAASMTMVVRRRAGMKAGWLAWTSMLLGISASLAANIAAAQPTLIGRAVAAWPPIALLLAYELLMNQFHTTSTRTTAHPQPTSAPITTLPPGKPTTATHRATLPSDAASTAGHTSHNTTPAADTPHNSPPATATTTAPAPALTAVPNRDEDNGAAIRQAARQRYLTTLNDGLPCTGRELADMYGMSERWGRYQIRAARRTHLTPLHQPHDPSHRAWD